MATTHHHAEDAPRPSNGNGRGNGIEGIRPEHVRQWLHFDGPVTWYSLLGVTPDQLETGMSAEELDTIITERIGDLAPHLQSEQENERDEAKRIAHLLENTERIKRTLLDPVARRAYDRGIFKKHPELEVQYKMQRVRHDVTQQIPQPASPLSRINRWIRHHPVVTAISAGVVAGSAMLFVALQPKNTSTGRPEPAAQQKLPENAPERTQLQPTAPTPSTPLPQKSTADTPAPDPVQPPVPEKPVPPILPKGDEKTPEPVVAPPADPAAAKPPAVPQQPDQTAQPPDTSPARKPVPSTEEQQSYSDLAKNPVLAKKTVDHLIEDARKSTDAAEQWALYRLALSGAGSHGDLRKGMEILTEMQRVFDGDDMLLQDKKQMVRQAAGLKDADPSVVMPALYAVMTELCDHASFAEARRYLAEMQRKSGVDRKKTQDIARYLTRIQTAYTSLDIAELQQSLDAQPGNPEASKAVGVYRCMELGDWSATQLLRDSGDETLRTIAERVERRTSLSAADRLTLARDLIALQSPPPAGAVAMAVECCSIAVPPPTPVEAARLKYLRNQLIEQHENVLPLVQRHDASPSAFPSLEQAQTADTVPSEAANVLSGTPELLRQRMRIARAEWKPIQQEGKTLLVGSSPFCGWCAWANIALTPEQKQTVQDGNYIMQVTFTLDPIAVPPGAAASPGDGRLPGTIGIGIPLPNGTELPFLTNARADESFRKAGICRTGYHTKSIGSFYSRQPPAFCSDFRQMTFLAGEKKPDGGKVTFYIRAVVHTTPMGIEIVTTAGALGEKVPRIAQPFAAPLAINGDTFIMTGDKGEGAPAPFSAGIGVAGQRMEVTGMSITSLPRSRHRR